MPGLPRVPMDLCVEAASTKTLAPLSRVHNYDVGTLQPSEAAFASYFTFGLSGIMVIETPDAVQKALSKLDDSDRGA